MADHPIDFLGIRVATATATATAAVMAAATVAT